MTTILEPLAGVLVDVSIKALILAAVAWAGLTLLRVRSSNVRHRTWTAVLMGMLLLPLLVKVTPGVPVWMYPAWRVPQADVAREVVGDSAKPQADIAREVIDGEAKTQAEVAPVVVDRGGLDNAARVGSATGDVPLWLAVLVTAYLIGAVVFVGRLAAAVIAARALVRGGRPISPGDGTLTGTPICESPAVRVPLTVGWRRPAILLPGDWSSWSASMLSAVLRHEQAHVARGDHWVTLLAEFNRAIYWFHPVAWFLRRRLAALAEAACDDAVIESLGDRTGYARHLLSVAGRLTHEWRRLRPAGVAMARTPQIEHRINAILDSRRPLARRLGLAGALALVAIAVPLVLLAAGLKPDAPEVTTVSGRIVDAESRPVAGAELRLIVAKQSPRGDPNQSLNVFTYWGSVQSGLASSLPDVLEFLSGTSGPDGAFQFEHVRSGPDVEIAYWGNGIAQGRVTDLQKLSDAERRDVTITAATPGIVRGTIDRQALPDVTGVQLGGPARLVGPNESVCSLMFWDDVTGQDRYEYRDVPPGSYGLAVYGQGRRTGPKSSTAVLIQQLDVEVRSGETTDVDVMRRGRPVVARLVMPKGLAPEFDWTRAIVQLRAIPKEDYTWPEIPYPKDINPRTDPEAAEEWVKKWLTTDAGKRYQEESIRYSDALQKVASAPYRADVKSDGSFGFADIPPGRYELTAGAPKPGASGAITLNEMIASVTHTFTVPEMPGGSSNEPLDLGDLTLQAVPRPAQ
jgi:hypothetical protein